MATIVAIIYGTLGLPVYVHSCRMMGAADSAPMCGMCESAADAGASGSEGTAMKFERIPCCKTDQIVHKTAPTVMPRGEEIPAPVLVLLVQSLLEQADPHAAETGSGLAVGDRPPPLASRSRSTYLLNSSFLI